MKRLIILLFVLILTGCINDHKTTRDKSVKADSGLMKSDSKKALD